LVNSKFIIDGEIEGKPQSAYLNNQKDKNSKKIKGGLWSLGGLCILLTLMVFVLLIKVNSLNNKLNNMKTKIKVAETLIQENQAYKEANDTLQKRIMKLKNDNDILAENSDSATGIFFEVQIGNFYDFNIDAYMNELEALRQEKSGNNSKLILGRFRSFQKAMLFENDIKKMGFVNAFLIGRIDGKLVDYQEALTAYQENQRRN
jgi:cell division protein FtsB